MRVNRRQLLVAGVAGLTALSPLGAAARIVGGERVLRFHNIHTGENLARVYWQNGQYLAGPLKEINHILRDWRAEDTIQMDVGVLDLLNDLRRLMDSNEPFHVISGYRSPKTNAKLRADSRGVAKKSLHMQGKAVDISLPGRDLRKLQKAAIGLQRGGVGYYGKSQFIHVDTGRVRFW
ncbi:MAG: DUF882 domain-containing protein [Alphaproteobacteria bacterium]|nr:DUF882 domain-containing protein [Alphaproteobacteria bacterium]